MNFRNLKLGTKQGFGFGIILIIMAGTNFYAMYTMGTLKAQIDEVSTNWLPRAVAISDINLNTSNLRLNQLQYAFATDEGSKQMQSETMITLIDKINENMDTYETLKTESERRNLYSDEERRLHDEFEDKWDDYQGLSFTFFALSRDGKTQEAIDLLNSEARQLYVDFGKDLEGLVTVNKTDAFDAATRAEITFSSTRKIVNSLFIVTILLSSFIAVGLVRFITVPVRQLEKAAGNVAKGDLDVRLDIASKDEIGNLALSFNGMTTSLREAKEKMQTQADELQAQNEQLQTTHAELEEKSQFLEQQKSEIEQKNHDLEIAMEQLKNAQEQLVMSEKMASLGNLVAGVAHEVNTPIGAVHSAADVISRCIGKIKGILKSCQTLEEVNSSEQFRKSLKILEDNNKVTTTASERITKIVRSLKTFARLDEAEFQKADIHEGLDNTLTLIDHEIKNRITVVRDYGQIPEISCYPNQLNQVFMNIFMNAVQAIEKAGQITIKSHLRSGEVVVTVSDSGRGIPPDNMDKIFDPGFTTGGVGVGTGLGLSISYNIIQKHHGEIKVESEVGKGSTFTVILPMDLEKAIE